MEQKLTYEALLKAYSSQVEKYNSLIDTSPDGILFLTAIRDANNEVVDFTISHCNRAGTILGHIPPNAQSQTLLTILPHLKDSEQFKIHKQVVDTGDPVLFETSFRNETGKEYGWFIVSLMKLGDAIFSRFIDITEKKENEKKREQETIFLNGILEASINGVFACEAVRNKHEEIVDFIILKVNKAFTEITDKTADEVEGKLYLSIYPKAKEAGMFDMFCQVIESGKILRKEMQATTGSGNWYDISIGRLNINSIAITFTNITERKNAFVEIENQRNLLNNIMQHSPSGITVTEVIRNENNEITDAKIVIANDITEQYTGISKEIACTKKISEIDPDFKQSGLLQMAGETLRTGKPFRTQYYYAPSKSWLELGVSKMDENRLVNIYTDVSEVKESQLKLEKLVDELKRSNSSLEEFTYAASHDLKEPIRKIRIFADRLKENHSNNMNDEGIKILERLIASSVRMRLLVDDLLEYTQVSLFEKEKEQINLNDEIKKVLIDLEVEIENKKTQLYIDTLPVVMGHKRQIQQLFQNVVSNALKYSKPDTAPIITISNRIIKGEGINTIITSEDSKKEFNHIKVKDNGIGFEEKNSEKIFRIFQRLHGAHEYEGTGVGLFIVKKIVEMHNGYITVNSQPGIGSCFNIYLPVIDP